MKNNKFVKRISALSILGVMGLTPKKQKTTNRNYSKDIGVEKAKSIALRDAGVSGVRFTKAKVDYEDGVKVYDIEFRKGNVEYEYEIDAATGSVRERSVDIDD